MGTYPEYSGGWFYIRPECDYLSFECFDITTAGPRLDNYGEGAWAWYSYVALFGGICCCLTFVRHRCNSKPKSPPTIVHKFMTRKNMTRLENTGEVSLPQLKDPEAEMQVAKLSAQYAKAN